MTAPEDPRKDALLSHMSRSGLPATALHGLDAIGFFGLSTPLSGSSSIADAHAFFRQVHIGGTRLVLNHPLATELAESLLSEVNDEQETITGVDGNPIRLYISSPKEEKTQPRKCVVFLHAGAMAFFSTCTSAFQAWCRLLARERLRVVAVDFRNAVCSPTPNEADNAHGNGSSHPFPAGLNDAVSALQWLADRDDVYEITVIGDSGGANLALTSCVRLAKQAGAAHPKIVGAVSWDPYIAGPLTWQSYRDQTDLPSLVENDGACFPSANLVHMGRVYTPEEKDWTNGEAWPLFLSDQEIDLLPQTFVHTSELDSLRDEGEKLADMLKRRGKLGKHVREQSVTHALHHYAPSLGMSGVMERAAKSVAEFALRAGGSEMEKGVG